MEKSNVKIMKIPWRCEMNCIVSSDVHNWANIWFVGDSVNHSHRSHMTNVKNLHKQTHHIFINKISTLDYLDLQSLVIVAVLSELYIYTYLEEKKELYILWLKYKMCWSLNSNAPYLSNSIAIKLWINQFQSTIV